MKEPLSTTKLPSEINLAYEEFITFHYSLKADLDQVKLKNSIAEKHFLDQVLSHKAQEYYNLIEMLANQTKSFSKIEKRQLFKYFMKIGLCDLVKGVPYFFQAIFKPRGYAGDAEMMALIYRNQFEGKTLFDKVMHKIGTECAAGVAIRNRRQLMLNEFNSMKEGKVLSLAAGPAQEIYDYYEQGGNALDFLALDHDIQTLIHAEKKLKFPNFSYGLMNAFHLIGGRNQILFPHPNKLNQCNPAVDIRDGSLLKEKYRVSSLEPASYNLIYSIGLFDYIQTEKDKTRGTTQLTKTLFDLLKPNGKLLIGNVSMAMPIGITWAMNCFCDWYLIHRTEAEVIEFASTINPNEIKSMEVVTEPLGINYFLKIEKK